jgi:hypothetical protein
LKSTSSFSGSYVGGWNPGYSGNKPNGTTGYMDTFLYPNLIANNYHIGVYSRTQVLENSNEIGFNTQPIAISLGLYYNAISNKVFNAGSYPTYTAFSANNNTKGFGLGVRTASNLAKLYMNGSYLAQNTVNFTESLSSTVNFALGAIKQANGAYEFSSKEQGFATIGDGLTDYEAKALYWIVQKYQTTLGRQVY